MDESGLILRIFNTGSKNVSSQKFDLIAVAVKIGDSFEYEKRTIIEIVNENTLIIDKPFPVNIYTPDYNFDFKMIALSTKQEDSMTFSDR
jgi:hypothetical protein